METPTQPARPIEMRKSARCGHRVPVSLRGCLFAVALVLLWSTAHAVGTPNTPVRPLLAAVADDEAAISERADRLTLLQEAPAPIEDEVDEGEFPNLTDPPMPTNTAAPPEPTPTPTTSVEPTPTLTTTVAPNTNNVISNNASNLRGTTANSVSPTLLVGFAVLCSAFLALWVRRRRDSGGADGGADGGEGGDSSMSDMATTSSTEKREDGGGKKKTQYSRLDNRAEEEELLDDEFGGRSGSWDDWENNQIHQRIDIRPEEEEEESRTGLTKGLGSSSIVTPQSPPPKSTGSVRTSTAGVKLTSPPSSSSGRGGGGAHLQDVVVSAPPPRPTSVASDSSSNESFEVVVSPPAAPLDLLSGGSLPSLPTTEDATPPASTASSTTAATTRAEDDLFSQFGLVPTFKKGVQQTPVAVATPVARSTYTAPSAAFLNPFAASPPPSSTSLFAADMDDMDLDGDAAAGANEWGDEEDDWVQGL